MKRTPAFALCAAVAMFSCLQAAADEPTNAPSANPAAPPTVAPSTATTNAPAPATPPPAENAANETQLPEISIYGRLDQARNQILPAAAQYQSRLAATIKTTEDVVSANNNGLKSVLDEVVENVNALVAGIESLKKVHTTAAGASSLPKSAEAYRDQVAPAMLKVRAAADTLEGLVADELWPLPKYRELLFFI